MSDSMHPDVMKCHEYLRPSEAIPLPAAAKPWVKELLRAVGWEEGMLVPSGLNDYFPAVLKVLGMSGTPTDARLLIQRDDVAITLRNAIVQANARDQQRPTAQEILGDTEDVKPEFLPELQRVAEQMAARETAPEEEEPPAQPEPAYTVTCPRCSLSLTQEYRPFTATEEDKEAYLFHVLGGERFTRRFDLFCGLGSVTLRTLTGLEMDEVRKASVEGSDPVLAIDQFFHIMLPMSVEEITVRGRRKPILPWSDSRFTSLRQYFDYWYSEVVASTELRAELALKLQSFLELTQGLQKELYHEDFWTGVSTRGW